MNRFLDQAVNSTDWHVREAIAGKCIKSALCLRNDDSTEVRKATNDFLNAHMSEVCEYAMQWVTRYDEDK